MVLLLILVGLVAFIVVATTVLRIHPFLALIVAAFLAAVAYGMPLTDIPKSIGEGFGTILGQIGIVIVLGTIIGVILERTGAAIAIAQWIIRLLGERFPTLTVSLIGYLVSIPVFCDSGYVILNSLKDAIAERLKVSVVAMSIALATGLYATHTFVPPTPGPIAAAGNLGLTNLGLLIALGLIVALVSAAAGMLWANRYLSREVPLLSESDRLGVVEDADAAVQEERGASLSAGASFAPIVVPIILICLGSVAGLPSSPVGDGPLSAFVKFIGQPITALLIGLACATLLIRGKSKLAALNRYVVDGILAAAPIILITGAGGAFGAILRAAPIGDYLGETLLRYNVGLAAPFIIAAGLKTAQGSTTVSLVATSALIAPLLGPLGYESDMGRALVVLAIGAGAITVSHANDSFFWVVSQFSRMPVATALRTFTTATLVQGIAGFATVYLLSFVLL